MFVDDSRVDVIACTRPKAPCWLERVSTVSKGRLHLHSSGLPSFPDDAIKGVPQTSKLVPSSQPKFPFDPSVFHSSSPSIRPVQAVRRSISAPISSTCSLDTPRPAQWRRKEPLVRSRDLSRPSLFCLSSTRRSRSLLLLRAASIPLSMLCESRPRKPECMTQGPRLMSRAQCLDCHELQRHPLQQIHPRREEAEFP
jgi:hypothetical protein